MQKPQGLTYRDAGVDIDAGDELVDARAVGLPQVAQPLHRPLVQVDPQVDQRIFLGAIDDEAVFLICETAEGEVLLGLAEAGFRKNDRHARSDERSVCRPRRHDIELRAHSPVAHGIVAQTRASERA